MIFLKSTTFLLALVFVFTLSVTDVGAQDLEFVGLSPGIPLVDDTSSVPDLLNAMLGLSVAIAAILSVVMLAIGGFKYMTTDSAFALGNAKEQIANAVIGLLIVLVAVLLLETINPDLVSMKIFDQVQITSGS